MSHAVRQLGLSGAQPAAAALAFSPDDLLKILDSAGDAILTADQELEIVFFNQGAEALFGYAARAVKGQPLDLLLPEGLPEAHGQRQLVRAQRQGGAQFWAEVSISELEVNGSTTFTLILRDATGWMLAEERLKASLREKEALLKEIHHRVKNNLQVVSSLLGLQSRMLADPVMRKMFQESQNRVHSMALLHESLYQSQSLSRVDFPAYIRQLAAHLFHCYGVSAERIHLRTDLGSMHLKLDAAVPCGLIINELVSNSLKYAFPDGRKGEVRIELFQHVDGTARLIVADNGVGLKAGVDWVSTRSLGLKLVRTLAEQLGAKIELHLTAGTEVQFAFAAAA